MFELIAGVLLAVGTTYYVLLPIFRPPVPTPGGTAARWRLDEGDDPDDDMSPQTVALRALKEIEFDRATGKLSDADYDSLKIKYTEEALVALRGDKGGTGEGGGRRAATHPASPVSRPSCPIDGPRPEPEAVFCSTCGRRLGTAPAYCARCGTALERDSRYCERCGARVAA
jgi:hypothetical protein